MPSLPTELGPYRALRLVAKGGMAWVFEAVHEQTGAIVALKIPRVEGDDPGLRARILAEIQAMARLSHRHVLPVHEWGERPGGAPWFAMPLLARAVDLEAYATSCTTRQLLHRVDELLDALAYVHDRGVLHQDIKPRNLLVDGDGDAPWLWLADFGIASLAGAFGVREEVPAQHEFVLGTPAYMSPEQLRGDAGLGPPSDLFGVGATLYSLFEGHKPFGQKLLAQVAAGRRTLPPPSFAARPHREGPDGLRALVARLLAHDPLERFPSASSLRMALASLRGADALPGARDDRTAPASGPPLGPSVRTERTQDVSAMARPDAGARASGRHEDAAGHAPEDATRTSARLAADSPDASPSSVSSGRRFDASLPGPPDSTGTMTASRSVAALAVVVPDARREAARMLLRRAGAQVTSHSGGTLLAVFGATTAQGHELFQAADAALALGPLLGQEGATGVGLTVGSAYARGVDVLGPAVDAALLLVGAARDGQVRVLPTLRDALDHRFVCTGDGVLLLQGRRVEPQEVPEPIGREAEIARLLGCARTASAARQSALVTVVARAGMGKSVVLRSVASALHHETPPWLVLRAGASVESRAEPLGPLREAVRAWAGLRPGGGHEAAEQCLTSALGASHRDEDASIVAGMAVLLTEPGAQPHGARVGQCDPRTHEFDLWGAFFDVLSRDRAVCLCLDDLHWTDATTRALLLHLHERMRDRPLFVLCGSRDATDIVRGGTSLELGPLEPEDAVALVERLLEQPRTTWSHELRRRLEPLLQLAGGHPLHVAEIARLAGQLGADLGAVPPHAALTLDAILQARIDALAPRERWVLQRAALVGKTFWPALLAILAEEPALRDDLDELLASLGRRHLIAPSAHETVAGLEEWGFTHDLLHERARAEIPVELAEMTHRITARWLEQHAGSLGPRGFRTIATHWERSGERLRAAAWDTRAGASAEASGAVDEARSSYVHALGLVDEASETPGVPTACASFDPTTGRVLPLDLPALCLAVARTLLDNGAPGEADAVAARTLESHEPERVLVRAEALRIRAEVARARGDARAAVAYLDDALAVVGPDGDRIMRALLLGRRGWLLGYVLGENDEGRACGQEALALLEGLDVPAIQSHIHSFLGANELRAGEWDRQLECNERALELGRRAGDIPAQVRAHINLSVCFTNRGTLAQAEANASRANELSLRAGLHHARIIAVNNLGLILLDQDDLDGAEALLRGCMDLCKRHDTTDVLHETLPTLGRLLLVRGRLDEALSQAREGLRLGREQNNAVGVALAHRVEAMIHAARDDRAEAARALESSLAALGPHGDRYERAATELCAILTLGGDATACEESLRAVGANVALERRRWSLPLASARRP